MRDPLALKGTFIFVTTLDMKRHHTVLLFHCIIFKAFWENAGSLLSHQVSMSLLIKDVLFRRMSSALPTLSSLQRLSGPPCSAKFLSLDHKKKSQCTSKMRRKINRRENKTINLLNRHSESPLWQDCFCMCLLLHGVLNPTVGGVAGELEQRDKVQKALQLRTKCLTGTAKPRQITHAVTEDFVDLLKHTSYRKSPFHKLLPIRVGVSLKLFK